MSSERIEIQANSFKVRPVTPADIPSFLSMETDVWGEMACTADEIESRLSMFPEGQLIALSTEEQVIGYNGLQFVHSLFDTNSTWANITGNGTIRTHAPEGQYMFGISLTVHRNFSGAGAGLLSAGFQLLLKQKKKGLFIGSRVPCYRKAAQSFSIEQWVYGENRQSHDPLVAFFQKHKFKIIKIIENYFSDPDSLNHGVLMYRCARNVKKHY